MTKLIIPMLSARNKQMLGSDSFMLLNDGNFHCLLNKYWHALLSGEYHMAVPNNSNLSLHSLRLLTMLSQLGMQFINLPYAGPPIDLRKRGAAGLLSNEHTKKYDSFVLGLPIGEGYSPHKFDIEAYYLNVSMQYDVVQKGITEDLTMFELATACLAGKCFVHDFEQYKWASDNAGLVNMVVSDKTKYFSAEYYQLLSLFCEKLDPLSENICNKLGDGTYVLVPCKLTEEFRANFDFKYAGKQALFTDPTRWLYTNDGAIWKHSLGLTRAISQPMNKRQYIEAVKLAKHVYYKPAKTVWHVQKAEIDYLLSEPSIDK